jgi:hypothetical protein
MFFKRRRAGRDAARPARLPADAPAGEGRPDELAGPGSAERAVVVRDTTDRDGVVLRVSAETRRALLARVQAR